MRRKCLMVAAAAALSLGATGIAFAQENDPDVTIQVVDDIDELDGVFLSLDAASDAEDVRAAEDEERVDRRDSERESDRAHPDRAFNDDDHDGDEVEASEHDDVDEGELEDRDVVETNGDEIVGEHP